MIEGKWSEEVVVVLVCNILCTITECKQTIKDLQLNVWRSAVVAHPCSLVRKACALGIPLSPSDVIVSAVEDIVIFNIHKNCNNDWNVCKEHYIL